MGLTDATCADGFRMADDKLMLGIARWGASSKYC